MTGHPEQSVKHRVSLGLSLYKQLQGPYFIYIYMFIYLLISYLFRTYLFLTYLFLTYLFLTYFFLTYFLLTYLLSYIFINALKNFFPNASEILSMR